MTKSSKQKRGLWFWIKVAAIVFAIMVLIVLIDMYTGFFITVAVIGALFFVLRKYKKVQRAKSSVASSTEQQIDSAADLLPEVPNSMQADIPSKPAPAEIPDGEKDYNLFDDIYGNAALCYQYTEKICLDADSFDLIPGKGGAFLTFKQEPDNEYDPKAVAIYLDGVKIGYIYRGLVQDMVNDYVKREWAVIGYINKYSTTDRTATYKIGFYKPLADMVSKKVSLVKTKKKIDDFSTRQDNLCFISEGDAVTVEYDCTDDCYVVYGAAYQELGELSKSGIAFIEGGDYKKIVGVVESCDLNSSGDIQPTIRIYLVK